MLTVKIDGLHTRKMKYEMASRQSISLEYLHFPFRFYPDLQVRNKRKTRLSIIISSWTFTLNTAHSHHHHHRWDGIAIEWVTQNVFKKTSLWSRRQTHAAEYICTKYPMLNLFFHSICYIFMRHVILFGTPSLSWLLECHVHNNNNTLSFSLHFF